MVRRKLADLRILASEENARYMRAEQFNQLVANLKRDGVLTSFPLIYQGTVLSGNHRVQAAIKAGIEESDCIEIVGELTEERRLAIQLSHNAITGEDDPSLLSLLYGKLSFDEKLYSGLTDSMFDAAKLDISAIGIGGVKYEELLISFLPEQADAFLKAVARMKESRVTLVGRLEDFDHFFDTVIAVKAKKNVFNTAAALRTMAELALKQLELEALASEAESAQD